jgi:hypothetical protein
MKEPSLSAEFLYQPILIPDPSGLCEQLRVAIAEREASFDRHDTSICPDAWMQIARLPR